MTQTVYWCISIGFATIALIISFISLRISSKSRSEQRQALLLSKKTDLLTKLTEAKGKFGHLAMVYSQKILFIEGNNLNIMEDEAERSRKNLELVMEQSDHCEEQYNQVQKISPSDLEAMENLLSVANSFYAHATAELEKEQEAFADLRKLLGK